MDYRTTVPVILLIMVLFMFMSETSKVNSLQYQLDNKNLTIDSLKHEIDTLQWESEIFDYNYSNNTSHLLSALMFVESSYDDSAYNASEDAVGCLQIRKCMVNDVNRILRKQKSEIRYNYDDRWVRYKSIQMFNVYCKHYNLNTSEEIARCWNGGPRGMQNEMTVGYWKKVSTKLDI
tara:strand:- start:104 stop:634 length:531 start_codon:yes stop_codon:yes gene_type:complete